jgi:hypothetical protein
MRNRFKVTIVIAIAAAMLSGVGAMLWLGPAASPPSVSVDLLGYTNRVGPYALVAITNHSESAITLHACCLVKYTSTSRNSAPRRITSFDANTLRVTRLRPHEGFVQDVFVFPASKSEWQLECNASYSSAWFEVRRSAEDWFRKRVRSMKGPRRWVTWHAFDSEWHACPE